MPIAIARNLEKALLNRIAEQYNATYYSYSLNITSSPKIELGELALPIAFDLARKVRRPPIEIAKELAADAVGIQGIGKADVAGDDEIREFIYQAARLPEEIVRQISRSLKLGQFCKFAFSLAQRYNLFYHKHHILSETDSNKKQCLLLAADLVRKQLTQALFLLGCDVPPANVTI